MKRRNFLKSSLILSTTFAVAPSWVLNDRIRFGYYYPAHQTPGTFLKFVEGLEDGNCQWKAFEELRAQSLAYEESMSKEWLTKYDVHPREWYDHWRLFWTPKGEAFIHTLDDEKA